MITAAINLFIVSLLILIVGMIKPKWILVWVDKPGRMPIIMIASVVFMIAAVLFGEGNKRKQQELATQTQAAQPTADVPAGK